MNSLLELYNRLADPDERVFVTQALYLEIDKFNDPSPFAHSKGNLLRLLHSLVQARQRMGIRELFDVDKMSDYRRKLHHILREYLVLLAKEEFAYEAD